MKICLIKLGTDTIVTESGDINQEVFKTIVDNIAKLKEIGIQCVLVCSGAVAVGKKRNPNINFSGYNGLRICASIGQPYLINELQSCLKYIDLVAAQILLTSYDFTNNDRKSILTHTIYDMLLNNIIPVINENDLISNEELDCIATFNDNDTLAVNVAILLSATWLFILSAGIDGLYKDYNNQELGIYKTINNINSVKNTINEIKSRGGRGGMLAKINSIEIAVKYKIKTYLINGFKAENIILGINKSESFIGTEFVI
jgi:glutamate 5-kinase